MHLVDELLHVLVALSPWLTFNGWVVGAGARESIESENRPAPDLQPLRTQPSGPTG